MIAGRDRRGETATVLALLTAVLAAFAPALSAPFQFDDWWAVVDNPAVRDLTSWWQALPGIRPGLKLSLALNWTLAPGATGFRAVNLAVHAINTLLLWALARNWLASLAPDLLRPRLAAFATALVFALHPIATEAVTYVSGRSISLMAMFYLASLLAQVRADEAAPARRLASPLLFAAALAVRETAITLPVALLLFARFRGDSWPAIARALRGHAVVAGLAVLAALLTPGYRSFFAWSLQTRDVGAQLLGQLEAHRYLLWRPLLGLHNNIDPDLRVPVALSADLALFALSGLALIGLAVAWRRRAPWLGFALAWYLLQLAPSNSLLPRLDLGNDRHLYLALAGPALVVGVLISQLRQRLLAAASLLAVAAVLAAATSRRNLDYRSELALWTATVTNSPGKARPWVNLGHARAGVGDLEGAAAAYRCALAQSPGYPQALINLAVLPTPAAGARAPATGKDCRAP